MLELITQMYNYMIFKMERSERKFLMKTIRVFLTSFHVSLKKKRKKSDYYDCEVELNQNNIKM